MRPLNKPSYYQYVGGISAFLVVYLTSSFVIATPEVFTNSFYVKLTGAHTDKVAHQLAKRNGFVNLGHVRFIFEFNITACFVPKEKYQTVIMISLLMLKYIFKSPHTLLHAMTFIIDTQKIYELSTENCHAVKRNLLRSILTQRVYVVHYL